MDTLTEKTPKHLNYQPRPHVRVRQLRPARHFANMLKARRKLIFKVKLRPPPLRVYSCEDHAAAQDQKLNTNQ